MKKTIMAALVAIVAANATNMGNMLDRCAKQGDHDACMIIAKQSVDQYMKMRQKEMAYMREDGTTAAPPIFFMQMYGYLQTAKDALQNACRYGDHDACDGENKVNAMIKKDASRLHLPQSLYEEQKR